MTPQLQQAIKLLQLSRMELVDMVRDEMLENPILEDAVETAAEQPEGRGRPRRRRRAKLERAGETETPVAEIREARRNAEVEPDESTDRAQAVNDFDWENYLDN